MRCSLTGSGLALIVSAALAAGCGPPGCKAPVGPARVTFLAHLTAGQTRGLVSLPWTTTDLTGSSDSLFLDVPAASCPHLRGAVVTESPADVTIQIYAALPYCSDGPNAFVVAPVRLAAPLGTRHLRHGPAVRQESVKPGAGRR